jgi:hypothetical protein
MTVTPAAGSSPGLSVGAVEDGLMWNTAPTVAAARYLGLRTMVVTLDWEPRNADLEPSEIDLLTRAVMGGGALRIVLAIHNNWMRTPVDAAARQRFCEYAANALRRFPQINDIIVWNEPNVGFFWRPQFDANGASEAPRGYFELISQCYDVLHAVRPSVNVVGPVNSHWGNDNPNAFSNVSHSPTRFIRELGAVYRASGRTRPIFDTLGHHPYPRSSDEHPSTKHTDEAVISVGDTERLLAVMQEAFGGTAQRIPQDGLPIWYLETGYQTSIPPSKASVYDGGFENWPGAVPDVAPGTAVDQAKQLTDSLRLMYCQPYVEAIFNFLLRDEREMAGWQSGVFWADGSPKGSLEAYRSVIQEVNEGRVNCAAVPGAGAPAVTASATRTPASARPTGATEQPKAVRSVTNIAYRGMTGAPFGKLRLRAQLTRGARPSNVELGARQVTFEIGKDTYLTTTNDAGVASVTPSPPTRPGTHRVEVRFRGDELSLGSGARATVRVVNSRGRLASRGRLRLSPRLSVTLAARSSGARVQGTLTLRQQGGRPHRVKLIALGLLGRGRIAWLSGTDGRNRYDIHIRPAAQRRLRVQIWRNNVPLHAAATVRATRLRITRR